MTISVAHWNTWDNSYVFHYAKRMLSLLGVLMASVMYLHFSMEKEDILEHTNIKCHLYTLELACRPLTPYSF